MNPYGATSSLAMTEVVDRAREDAFREGARPTAHVAPPQALARRLATREIPLPLGTTPAPNILFVCIPRPPRFFRPFGHS